MNPAITKYRILRNQESLHFSGCISKNLSNRYFTNSIPYATMNTQPKKLSISPIHIAELYKMSIISKLKKHSNFFGNFFLKVSFQILCGMGSVYTLDSVSPLTPKNLFYRREMSCLD